MCFSLWLLTPHPHRRESGTILLTPAFEPFMRSPLSPLFSGLNRPNTLLTLRVARRCHTSPREAADGPSLEAFKAGFYGALSPRSLLPPSPLRPSLRPALPARPSRRQLRAAAPPPWPPGSMAAAVETRRVCETAGCSSEAKLQCPTCLKLGIQGSYFCSQVSSPAAQPLARRSGRAAGARSGSPRRLPAARARPGVPGSASLPARPRPAWASSAPPETPQEVPPRLLGCWSRGSRASGPGGAGAPFFLVAAGGAGPRRHRSAAGALVGGCTDVLCLKGWVVRVPPLKIKAYWDKVRTCSSNSSGCVSLPASALELLGFDRHRETCCSENRFSLSYEFL